MQSNYRRTHVKPDPTEAITACIVIFTFIAALLAVMMGDLFISLVFGLFALMIKGIIHENRTKQKNRSKRYRAAYNNL